MKALSKRLKEFSFPSILFFFLILLLSLNSGFSQNLENRVVVHKLKNGLTFVFLERHEVPVFASVYGFKVGGVDEPTGLTGLSHILEHMAFKGTTRIGTKDFKKEKVAIDKIHKLGAELSMELGKGEAAEESKIKKIKEEMKKLEEEQKKYIVNNEIFSLYQNAGGMGVNAGTSIEATNFTASLPSNQLELWCLIESERIKDPVFREFYTEKDVVQQERKQVVDGNPVSQFNETFMTIAFAAHAYRNPVAGWASDIKSVTLEEALEFRNKYYVPKNCVAALVGDIDPEKAIPLIEKYFGGIPGGQEIPVLRTSEPPQLGEKRFTLEADAQPLLRIGYHKPTEPYKDSFSLTMLASILTTGRTSRMQKDLVQDRQLASQIYCNANFPGQRYDNLFVIIGTPTAAHTPQELEKAIYEHLERLKVVPVEEKELQRIKNILESSTLRALRSNESMANLLWRSQLFLGDWRNMLESNKKLLAVTPGDIMEVAKTYFTVENRTVGYLLRKQKGEGTKEGKNEK